MKTIILFKPNKNNNYYINNIITYLTATTIWIAVFIMIIFYIPFIHTESLLFLSLIFEIIGLGILIYYEKYLFTNYMKIQYAGELIVSIINAPLSLVKWIRRYWKYIQHDPLEREGYVKLIAGGGPITMVNPDDRDVKIDEMLYEFDLVKRKSVFRTLGYSVMALGFLYQLLNMFISE